MVYHANGSEADGTRGLYSGTGGQASLGSQRGAKRRRSLHHNEVSLRNFYRLFGKFGSHFLATVRFETPRARGNEGWL